MRIIINAQLLSLARSYRNAGISRFISALLCGLSQLETEDHFTALVASQIADQLATTLPHMRIVATQWPTADAAPRVAWEQLALAPTLRRLGAEVFHSPAHALPPRLPCPSVLTIHDLAFLRYPHHIQPARRRYLAWITRRSARLATRLVAVSESTKRDLVTWLGIPEQRIAVVYPGIDEDFQPLHAADTLHAFRAKHGLPPRYLLFLGTLEPRKNLVGLVEAYARLRTHLEDAPPLVIAGGRGWYFETLFARVRAFGLERVVLFPGYVAREELPLWYAAATLFLYPSLYEGFGLPIVEAQACGTPVITSNRASMPEASGPAAIQVDPSDLEGLAQAMQIALTDTALQTRGATADSTWARGFTLQRMAVGYAAQYALAGAPVAPAERI
ncbi:MAG: glycosyltransferase family 4 protein [Ktedonobacterales bacterium]|nr:glycosyltransferase family 4 protein [Ktedonobacterales bacterium]